VDGKSADSLLTFEEQYSVLGKDDDFLQNIHY
nr:hypothetical protein [Tanacetum cinerariifolium]